MQYDIIGMILLKYLKILQISLLNSITFLNIQNVELLLHQYDNINDLNIEITCEILE